MAMKDFRSPISFVHPSYTIKNWQQATNPYKSFPWTRLSQKCCSHQLLLPTCVPPLHSMGRNPRTGRKQRRLASRTAQQQRATDEGARPRARSASAELKGTPPAVSSTMEVSVSKTGNDSELCGVGAAKDCGTIEYAIEHRCSCWLLTLC